MDSVINGLNISFTKVGLGDEIIFLHGWGSNKETFDKVVLHLKEEFCCYQIDLPGFGNSEIKQSLSLEEYTNILREFIISNNIKNPIILGHSFGGRIGINYASLYDVKKLILVNSAGVRKFNLKVYLKIKLYKLCKKLKIKNNFGSVDYKNSTNIFLHCYHHHYYYYYYYISLNLYFLIFLASSCYKLEVQW